MASGGLSGTGFGLSPLPAGGRLATISSRNCQHDFMRSGGICQMGIELLSQLHEVGGALAFYPAFGNGCKPARMSLADRGREPDGVPTLDLHLC